MLRSLTFILVVALHAIQIAVAQQAWPDSQLSAPDLPLPLPSTQGGGFGNAVALDGDLLCIGADRDSPSMGPGSGALYAFVPAQIAGEWLPAAKLFPTHYEQFGSLNDFPYALTVENDVIVASGSNARHVEVFVRSPWGPFFSAGPVLIPAGFDASAGGPKFGSALLLKGGRLFIGAERATHPGWQIVEGIVFEYQLGPLGGWWLVNVIRASDWGAGKRFGASIALSDDTLVVGAPSDNTVPGSAYVFTRQNDGSWLETEKVVARNSFSPYFGADVAIVDGQLAVGPAAGSQGLGLGVDVYEADPVGSWQFIGFVSVPTGQVNASSPGVALRNDEVFLADANGFTRHRRDLGGVWNEVVGGGLDVDVADCCSSAVLLVDGGYLFRGCSGCQPSSSSAAQSGIVVLTRLDELSRSCPDASIAQLEEQDLFLDFGLTGAGRFYFMLGSVSGTSPGIALPNSSDTLPLVFDAYTSTLLDRPTFTISNGWGVLNELGRADAQFRVPNGLDPSFAGLVLHHAAVTLDPANGALAASNAVAVELVP